MEKKTKVFIGQIKSVNKEEFTIDAIVSDETIDRYGEVILADAYKKRLGNYKKHGILLSSHNYGSLLKQIGMAENIKIEDGKLTCKFKYFYGEGNEEADWAWKLASKYKVAAFSVGFLPYDYEEGNWEKDAEAIKAKKKPCRKYTDVELLEISQVLVPANPMALQKSIDEVSEDIDEITKTIIKEYSEEVLNLIETEKKDLETDVITKPDTENYIHIANPGEDGKHKGHEIKTVNISKKQGISAHYCISCKVITGYMFDKEKGWDHEKAQAWVNKHKKEFEEIEIGFLENKDTKTLDMYINYFINFDEYLFKIGKGEKELNKIVEEEMKEELLNAINDLDEKLKNDLEKIFIEINELNDKLIKQNNKDNDNNNIETEIKEKKEKDFLDYAKELFETETNKLKEIFPVQS